MYSPLHFLQPKTKSMNHENDNHQPLTTQEISNQENCAPEMSEANEVPVQEANPPMPPSVVLGNEDGVTQPNVPEHDVLPVSEPDSEAGDKTAMPSLQ